MLTIRDEQIQALARADVARFEQRVFAHLKEFFPAQCRPLTEQELRRTIRVGLERAASYEIVSQRDVCMFIDLMMVLGRDFDTDKRFPWAQEILAKPSEPAAKMDALYQIAPKIARHV
jgi:hypothetical protein